MSGAAAGVTPVAVTFFENYAAATKREQALDLADLAHQIETTTGPTKADLPWLKLARFGDIRTEPNAEGKGGNSLRHNANMLAVTGIEADYDGEVLGFDEAHERLGAAGLRAILYTSPSHTEDAPRWRVLCPLSAEYPPDRRDGFLARLNGLFGGIFANESWTRSQSYYYGSVNRNPSHRVALLDGTPIDQADELDAIAIGKPEKSGKTNGAAHQGPATPPEAITDRRINGLFQSLLDNISAAQDQEKHYALWDNGLAIGGRLYLSNWSDSDAIEACMAALAKCNSEVKSWPDARKTATDAIAAGRLKPLPLEDSPEYLARMRERAAGVYDPAPPVGNPLPPPPPEPEPNGEEHPFQDPEPPPPPEPPWPDDEEPDGDPRPEPPPDRSARNGAHRPGRILTGRAFIADHVPPVWLIDGIVQRSRLYACTSLTGHGKTAVWLFNACMIHFGRKIGHLDAFKGNVLILAGENPSDLKARMIGMARAYNIPLDQLPYVLPGNFPMNEDEAKALKVEIAGLRVPLVLIVGDTASSFFPGDNENDNVQAGNYARTLRTFTEDCEGHPAVVALCHPIKGARRDDLLPRGGGAFLNELDANLILWSQSQGEVTEMHWHGKIRGPDFAAFGYRLHTVETGLTDEKKRPEITIIAEPMSEEAIADHSKQTLANEDAVLMALRDHPEWSLAQIAEGAGWIGKDGKPMKQRAQRAIRTLAAGKLVTQVRPGAPWTLTDKGKEAIATKPKPWTDADVDITPKAAPEPLPPTEAEIAAEIQRIAAMTDAAFLALDHVALAARCRCKPHQLPGLRKRAQAAKPKPAKPAKRKAAAKPKDAAKIEAKVAAEALFTKPKKATKPRGKKAAKTEASE